MVAAAARRGETRATPWRSRSATTEHLHRPALRSKSRLAIRIRRRAKRDLSARVADDPRLDRTMALQRRQHLLADLGQKHSHRHWQRYLQHEAHSLRSTTALRNGPLHCSLPSRRSSTTSVLPKLGPRAEWTFVRMPAWGRSGFLCLDAIKSTAVWEIPGKRPM